ncbi:sarcoplasmic calcium-binding protein-like [Uranotaenia lowii]|uniref:sarcoplasmic calcium-binding protein-like n=1 Tax=Uranotaenia lowii TaxID=190385 RepID=UPI00247A7714|nr:sarcoplasmic calcium-binding protein-like [Uranotaenia lowii]
MAFAVLRNCVRFSTPSSSSMGKRLLVERNLTSLAAINLVPHHQQGKTSPLHVVKTQKSSIAANTRPSFLSTNVRQYSKKSNRPERAYESDSDSDSDDERSPRVERKIKQRRERGTSEFWRRKMRTLHGLLDVNNDGVISYDDFRLLTEKFGSLGHLDDRAKDEFREIMKSTWTEQWGEITPYNLITVEQYLADMHHVVNDKDLRRKVHRFLPYLYRAVDKDHSGAISLNEFKLFFRCLGLTEENAAVSFAVIDKNGDGQITLDEFIKLGRDFLLTENEANASRLFWGPLVDH